MRRHSFWSSLYYSAATVQYLALTSATAVGLALKTNPRDYGADLEAILSWTQGSAWWLLLTLGVTGVTAKVFCTHLGPPWVWKAIHKLLNKFREAAFGPEARDPVHGHRVTLFKHTGFLWWVKPFRHPYWPWGAGRSPWSGWLVPVARSGHTTQRTNAVFLAPDDADNAEGVAGQTWATNAVVKMGDLPEITIASDDATIKEYATKAYVSEAWIRMRLKKNLPCPRSMCGIPVEVNGKLWGVVVLDSRANNSIKYTGHSWNPYTEVVPLVLSELLKRV